jgi:hypothetical protein
MVGSTDKEPLNYTYFPKFYHLDGVVVTNTASCRDIRKHSRIHSRITDCSNYTQSYFAVLALVGIHSPNPAGPVCNRELG